jgi:hypothetical protein
VIDRLASRPGEAGRGRGFVDRIIVGADEHVVSVISELPSKLQADAARRSG